MIAGQLVRLLLTHQLQKPIIGFVQAKRAVVDVVRVRGDVINLPRFQEVAKRAPADRVVVIQKKTAVQLVLHIVPPFQFHGGARVSADGQLYTCLFAGGGTALRPLLALGEDALAIHVAGLWRQRGDRYSEIRSEAGASRRHVEMFLVGG